jgi:hypothetical protein
MPLVWTGYVHQGLLSFAASLAVFYLCFRLAERLNYARNEACWFALAFCFGTSFIGVAALASSNFLAHVLAVLFLFWAINEYEDKYRPWLIGGLIGLAMGSRAPAGLNILFFILAIFLVGTIRTRVIGLIKLLLPFGAIAGLLALYNFTRFGNPLESGYSYQLNGFGMPYAVWNVPGNTAGPPVSLSNVPKHLWIFLFGLPSSNAVGTSVLLMSPFFTVSAPMGFNQQVDRFKRRAGFVASSGFSLDRLRAGRLQVLARLSAVYLLAVNAFTGSTDQWPKRAYIHGNGD